MLSRENRKIAFDMVKKAVKEWDYHDGYKETVFTKDNFQIEVDDSFILAGRKSRFKDYKTRIGEVEIKLTFVERVNLTFHFAKRGINERIENYRNKVSRERSNSNSKFEVLSERFLNIEG